MSEHIEKQPQVTDAYRKNYDAIDWNKRAQTADDKIDAILQRQQDHDEFEQMMARMKKGKGRR